MELVGRRLHPHAKAEALRLLAQPDAAVVVPAHEAEVVGAEAEDGGIVDHAAALVAERPVDDLADREAPHVAGEGGLQERLRVGAEDLELAQR